MGHGRECGEGFRVSEPLERSRLAIAQIDLTIRPEIVATSLGDRVEEPSAETAAKSSIHSDGPLSDTN